MNDIIELYVTHTYSEHQLEDIVAAFALMSVFELPHYEQKYDDLLHNSENMATFDVQMNFYNMVQDDIKNLLDRHGIRVTEFATLEQMNDICNSLMLLQNLENTEPVLIVLEGLEPDETKLIRIISDYTVMDEADMYTVVESIESKLIDALKQVCIATEGLNDTIQTKGPTRHIEILKVLAEYCKSDKYMPVGIELTKTGFQPGYKFSSYIGMLGGSTVEKTYEDVAKDVYSLLIISEDGINAPMVIYRKYSDNLFDAQSTALEVERHLVTFIKNFQDFSNAYHAQNSISLAST